MAGGLMQLVAYGAQDVYLTGNPTVTFFQAVYKKHTNFAMENIEQTVNGSANNTGRISVTIARNGDLVGEMYLEMEQQASVDKFTTDDSAADTIWMAERCINSVELSIGGQRIDKHYQRWWRLWSELNLDDAKKAEYGKMTSSLLKPSANAKGRVMLPLIFFFNRNPGLYLPLIALQYHEVRLDFDLSSVYETYANGAPKVWANYVYLDTEERRRFAQKGHEYLIEQVQHTGDDSVTTTAGSTNQLRMSYNHPVKELVWCYSNTSTSVKNTNALWNFTGPGVGSNVSISVDPTEVGNLSQFTSADAASLAFADTSGVTVSLYHLQFMNVDQTAFAVGTAVVYTDNGFATIPQLTTGTTYFVASVTATLVALALTPGGAAIAITPGGGAAGNRLTVSALSTTQSSSQIQPHHVSAPHVVVNSNVTDYAFKPWAEEADVATQLVSTPPLDNFKLILNGQDRFKAQPGKYFNQVQPYNYHSGTPYPGIYSYSFALKPEEHQPTGTCNFSRIDNAQVQATMKKQLIFGGTGAIQSMFAVNYNVLRIQSGMGGLAFSN